MVANSVRPSRLPAETFSALTILPMRARRYVGVKHSDECVSLITISNDVQNVPGISTEIV